MTQNPTWIRRGLSRGSEEHVAQTAVAATLSLVAARIVGLPEAYWAPISALVVTQSTLGAAWTISRQRLAGTALGAALGALLAPHLPPLAAAFGACVFGIGLVCAILRLDKAAYRFAGITFAIVMLVRRAASAWTVAMHRFAEVSLGIAVGLALTAAWPTLARRGNFLPASGAVVAASLLLYWGTGLHPLWWLTWFAALPILLIAIRLGAWAAFLTSAGSWFLGSLNMWRYLLSAIQLPPALVVIISVVPACLFGIAVLLFRKFILRGVLWKAALAFPAFWVSLEYVNNITSPHGTFPNMGYTQMDFLPVLQVASLVGIWGISFCLFLFPATIAALLSGRGSAPERARLAIAAGVSLAAVIGYGSWRLVFTPASEHSLKVGLMATGVDTPFPHGDSSALELLRDYSEKAQTLAAQGAQIIVLPEKIALVSDQATGQVDALYAATADRAKASVVVGLDRGTLAKRFNEARLYLPGVAPAVTYDKHHMVPRIEGVDQPGTTLTVLDEPSGIWGIEICKDMDFPRLSREYGAKGVGLLLVPAWDFTLDGWLHDRMAVMRGVEDGFTIVRAAKQGVLTVSDDRGRILAERDSATVRFATLLATAPVRHDRTLYTQWGDWFAWLNIAGLILILFSRTESRPLDPHRTRS